MSHTTVPSAKSQEMDRKFNNHHHHHHHHSSNPYINQQEDTDRAQENIAESPPSSTIFNIDGLVSSSTSSLKRRRAIQKRVVQIPIKDAEGSRLKGESNTPPFDSWAWRKYGQKPIKGSPYPRGYYRCSSSKGCPARKQVERSRVDPTMLVVTYSSEHNHPWPVSRNHHHHNNNNNNHASAAIGKSNKKPEPDMAADPADPELEPESEEKFADLGGGGDESLITTADELGWFGEMEASSAVLESPILTAGYDAGDVFLPMREEDESLFADLGELPECSVVFRRGVLEVAAERRRCTAPWCGTTS